MVRVLQPQGGWRPTMQIALREPREPREDVPRPRDVRAESNSARETRARRPTNEAAQVDENEKGVAFLPDEQGPVVPGKDGDLS
jgi:hypothetical protein